MRTTENGRASICASLEGIRLHAGRGTMTMGADVTHDHQYIHIDPERAAAETPFGGTIAHGFLTLSMLTHLQESIGTDLWRSEGLEMFLNYGFDKVRFISPVPTGARIRASAVLSKAEVKGDIGPDHPDHDRRDRGYGQAGPGR